MMRCFCCSITLPPCQTTSLVFHLDTHAFLSCYVRMAIQLATGPRSLIALGVGAGDLATLYALGQRVGNWLTAAPGDRNLLEFLEQDEMDLFRRRGLIDIDAFNKRWGKSI